MKHITIIVFLLFSGTVTFSQNYNPALLNSYSTSELDKLNETEISLLEYSIHNACYTTPLPSLKDLSVYPEITMKSDVKNIKFTDLKLKILDKTQYFRIQGKDELLVVKSHYVLELERKNKNLKH